jgi:hypothetical protein
LLQKLPKKRKSSAPGVCARLAANRGVTPRSETNHSRGWSGFELSSANGRTNHLFAGTHHPGPSGPGFRFRVRLADKSQTRQKLGVRGGRVARAPKGGLPPRTCRGATGFPGDHRGRRSIGAEPIAADHGDWDAIGGERAVADYQTAAEAR